MLKARFYLSNDDFFFFFYYLLGSFRSCKFNDFNCIFTSFFFLSTLNKEIIIIMLFGFYIPSRISKTLGRGFKLLAEDLEFSFRSWKWIPAEPDNFWYRPRDMINLFNFGIKAVVHIVIKYDNSQIKNKKKSVKLPKTI